MVRSGRSGALVVAEGPVDVPALGALLRQRHGPRGSSREGVRWDKAPTTWRVPTPPLATLLSSSTGSGLAHDSHPLPLYNPPFEVLDPTRGHIWGDHIKGGSLPFQISSPGGKNRYEIKRSGNLRQSFPPQTSRSGNNPLPASLEGEDLGGPPIRGADLRRPLQHHRDDEKGGVPPAIKNLQDPPQRPANPRRRGSNPQVAPPPLSAAAKKKQLAKQTGLGDRPLPMSPCDYEGHEVDGEDGIQKNGRKSGCLAGPPPPAARILQPWKRYDYSSETKWKLDL